MNCPVCGRLCNALPAHDQHGAFHEWCCSNEDCMWTEGDPLPDELKMIRLLRSALASIWTALETDTTDVDQIIADAQLIADEGLDISVKYASRGKDLTDDSIGLESWRRHVSPDLKIIKDPW